MTTSSTELLQRLDEGWRAFEAAFTAATDDQLKSPTSAGWTGVAMLAHVAAWHDATAYRLHRFAATGRPQPKVEADDDAFNARVADETARQTPAAARAVLAASFARFREALSGVPRGVDDGWVEAVVTNNSFGHYAEHLAELASAAER